MTRAIFLHGELNNMKTKKSFLLLVICFAMLLLAYIVFSNTLSATENPLASATDVELIEAIISSQAIEDWSFMSSPHPYSAEGIEKLCEDCGELKELLSRETGLASLKYESPALIEAYKNSGEGHDGLKASALELLTDYLCAGLPDDSQ